MDLWPVYVITRSRVGRITPDILSLSPILVVEPKEAPIYHAAYPHLPIEILGDNGHGVSFARNGARLAALRDGHPSWWLLDDDLHSFRKRHLHPDPPPHHETDSGLMPPTPTAPALSPISAHDALLAAQRLATDAQHVGLVGIGPLWTVDKLAETIIYNQKCLCCIALHNNASANVQWDDSLTLWEDTDMSLQICAAGWNTLTTGSLTYDTPRPSTNPGGLFDSYRTHDIRRQMSQRLVNRWPELISLKPRGHIVHWDRIPPRGQPQGDRAHPIPCDPTNLPTFPPGDTTKTPILPQRGLPWFSTST